MKKDFLKYNSVYIFVFTLLVIVLTLAVISSFVVVTKQSQKFQIDDIEVVEYKLPSLDLEKYKQLDKITPQE